MWPGISSCAYPLGAGILAPDRGSGQGDCCTHHVVGNMSYKSARAEIATEIKWLLLRCLLFRFFVVVIRCFVVALLLSSLFVVVVVVVATALVAVVVVVVVGVV